MGILYALVGALIGIAIGAALERYCPSFLAKFGWKPKRYWWNELKKIEAELKARGVKDVKFVWSPEIAQLSSEEIAKDVLLFMRAILDGKTHPAPPIGDSHISVEPRRPTVFQSEEQVVEFARLVNPALTSEQALEVIARYKMVFPEFDDLRLVVVRTNQTPTETCPKCGPCVGVTEHPTTPTKLLCNKCFTFIRIWDGKGPHAPSLTNHQLRERMNLH